MFVGREPWSSGYGRRFMFRKYHILDGHFSHLFLVKFVVFVVNEKEAEGGPV